MTSWDTIWWTIMVCIAALNLCIALSLATLSRRWAKSEPQYASYMRWLRVLGLIFTCVACYRSIFVSSYPNRLAWFDTLCNSPFVIRSLATFAELSFIGSIAIILRKKHQEYPLTNPWLIRMPAFAFGCIFLAQFFAFGGLVTQYMTLFAIEESLWAIAFLALVPLAVVRLRQKELSSSYRAFLIILAVWCGGYLAFQAYSLPFIHFAEVSHDIGRIVAPDALHQAIFGFTATRDFAAWGGLGFFIWHSGYFSVCVWMILYFMGAPRKSK